MLILAGSAPGVDLRILTPMPLNGKWAARFMHVRARGTIGGQPFSSSPMFNSSEEAWRAAGRAVVHRLEQGELPVLYKPF